MLITHEVLSSVSGVENNSTFTVKIPTGWTYHDLIMLLGGTAFTPAMISNLTLWVNGKPRQVVLSGTELDTRNKFDGIAAVANSLLRFTFERTNLDLREARQRTLLGTGLKDHERAELQNKDHPLYDPVKVKTVELTGKITGATAPTLVVKARRSGASPTSVLTQIRNFTRNPSGAGDFEVSDLPDDEPLSRVIFKEVSGAGVILKVELKINGFTVFERTKAENDQIQIDGIRTPQSGWFVYDPAEDGAGNNSPAFDSDDDVRWIVTTDDAMNLGIQYETIGTLR